MGHPSADAGDASGSNQYDGPGKELIGASKASIICKNTSVGF
jgi:hypothetical protein